MTDGLPYRTEEGGLPNLKLLAYLSTRAVVALLSEEMELSPICESIQSSRLRKGAMSWSRERQALYPRRLNCVIAQLSVRHDRMIRATNFYTNRFCACTNLLLLVSAVAAHHDF